MASRATPSRQRPLRPRAPRRPSAGKLIAHTFAAWHKHNASLLAAGISYFTLFSLVPLVIVAVALASFVLGEDAAEGILAARLADLVGTDSAGTLQSLVTHARESGAGKATFIGGVLLFFAASRLFLQIQAALNVIWGERPAPQGANGFLHLARKMLFKRLISFGMVLITGALLVASFFIDTAVNVVRTYVGEYMTVLANVTLWEVVNIVVSFLLLTIMTAFIYQFLPDTDIAWSNVWIGAALTSLLLTLGRFAIAFYFRVSDVGSVYGLAGSFAVIVVGVYFSTQVFLFGAEFTRVYSTDRGTKVGEAKPAPARAEAARRHGTA